ncbi:MAG: cell wall metabolism sensor histidine kinase WalK [Anaerolineae bacterium]|nr:cell wall metabolism sensor histidine kinase WalK [Anaerolineae bacterium]
MGQVLNNLLSNAIKYTPEGGNVTLGASQRQGRAIITISDTGYGIPADALPHLFEKFFRVKRPEHMAEKGTGLGLAIVKGIVEQHGGEIRVESTLGAGTSFSVLLPLEPLSTG